MLSLQIAQLQAISARNDAASNLYRARDNILTQIANPASFRGTLQPDRYSGVKIAQNNFIMEYLNAWQSNLSNQMKKDFESKSNGFNTFA